jgi:dinuclear metal center YbgI/SA1388 family protein
MLGMAKLDELVGYADGYLDVKSVADWPDAWNGLQLGAAGAKVTKIGAAVDACEAVLEEAVQAGVDLLVVHHGLFWGGVQPVVGAMHRKLKLAIEHGLAVYSAHLPLDVHPRVGNNVLLAKALGMKKWEPFFFEKGRHLGVKARMNCSVAELAARLERVLGTAPHLARGGVLEAGWVGVVTGGAGGQVARACREGVDTFVTGEGPHHSYTAAEELGINLFYAGHYATETFGVKAFAAHLARRYRLEWVFLDHPTGL